jgi:hypothetical protein
MLPPSLPGGNAGSQAWHISSIADHEPSVCLWSLLHSLQSGKQKGPRDAGCASV